jgi:hypothetical protein
MTFGVDYGYKDGAERMILSATDTLRESFKATLCNYIVQLNG